MILLTFQGVEIFNTIKTIKTIKEHTPTIWKVGACYNKTSKKEKARAEEENDPNGKLNKQGAYTASLLANKKP